jgi:hypothetical protein
MARDDELPHAVMNDAQMFFWFYSEAKSMYDASDTLRQLPRQAHSEVCEAPQAPEQADNTPQLSPMRPRQLRFRRTCKGIVKRPKGDVRRRVRVKWIPHYVKAKNPPKSKMLWFHGTVIEHSTTANVRTHKV